MIMDDYFIYIALILFKIEIKLVFFYLSFTVIIW